MLNWLRRRRSGRLSAEEFDRLRDELKGNEAREDAITETLHSTDALSAEYIATAPERIFRLRDERVRILRRLGWTESADEPEADTARRRRWTREGLMGPSQL